MLVLQDAQSLSVRKGFLGVQLAGFEGGMRKNCRQNVTRNET